MHHCQKSKIPKIFCKAKLKKNPQIHNLLLRYPEDQFLEYSFFIFFWQQLIITHFMHSGLQVYTTIIFFLSHKLSSWNRGGSLSPFFEGLVLQNYVVFVLPNIFLSTFKSILFKYSWMVSDFKLFHWS